MAKCNSNLLNCFRLTVNSMISISDSTYADVNYIVLVKNNQDTEQLYDGQAQGWNRQEPILLSDYSARPFVIDLCEPIAGLRILDIGCGEGYVGRKLIERGAKHVHGLDLSSKMIEIAQATATAQQLHQASYETRDVRLLQPGEFEPDLVLAMFLFNYLNSEDTTEVMRKVYAFLKPGGRFVFSVPHPSLAFLKKDQFPFYFETKGGYFSGRNILFPGEIWRRDGVAVGVQCVHKTVTDYFMGLKAAGFSKLPEVHELHITDEHIAMDPAFFGPLKDLPLHIAFSIEK